MVIVTKLIKTLNLVKWLMVVLLQQVIHLHLKMGTVPMMLKEDDDGYYQSFTEEKEHTVTGSGPMDLLTRMVTLFPCLKKEFSNARYMTAGNAQNVHSLIKDESGHFQKLSGGTLHTNEKRPKWGLLEQMVRSLCYTS